MDNLYEAKKFDWNLTVGMEVEATWSAGDYYYRSRAQTTSLLRSVFFNQLVKMANTASVSRLKYHDFPTK